MMTNPSSSIFDVDLQHMKMICFRLPEEMFVFLLDEDDLFLSDNFG